MTIVNFKFDSSSHFAMQQLSNTFFYPVIVLMIDKHEKKNIYLKLEISKKIRRLIVRLYFSFDYYYCSFVFVILYFLHVQQQTCLKKKQTVHTSLFENQIKLE